MARNVAITQYPPREACHKPQGLQAPPFPPLPSGITIPTLVSMSQYLTHTPTMRACNMGRESHLQTAIRKENTLCVNLRAPLQGFGICSGSGGRAGHKTSMSNSGKIQRDCGRAQCCPRIVAPRNTQIKDLTTNARHGSKSYPSPKRCPLLDNSDNTLHPVVCLGGVH